MEQVEQPLVSVVMPCYNEEETVGTCVKKIKNVFKEKNIPGEVIVCDNASSDKSAAIAKDAGANVVYEDRRGYGNAYLTGFSAAKGKYFVMGDADDTYDFGLIPEFLNKLREEKYDFVTGSRYLSKTDIPIPLSHRYIGNPLLTRLLNFFFGTKFSDVYCGLRGFTREAFEKIRPVSTGMEFNLELAINTQLSGLKWVEVPITLAERKGESKLRTIRDGWRSLRMMLLYCPNKVFILPGVVFLMAGILLHALPFFSFANTLAFKLLLGLSGSTFCVLSLMIVQFGLQTKTYSWSQRFEKDNNLLTGFYKRFKLEAGLILGGLSFLFGCVYSAILLANWGVAGADLANPTQLAYFPIGVTAIMLGIGTIFSSLMISSMSMKDTRSLDS